MTRMDSHGEHVPSVCLRIHTHTCKDMCIQHTYMARTDSHIKHMRYKHAGDAFDDAAVASAHAAPSAWRRRPVPAGGDRCSDRCTEGGSSVLSVASVSLVRPCCCHLTRMAGASGLKTLTRVVMGAGKGLAVGMCDT